MTEWFSTEIRYQGRNLNESIASAAEHKSFSQLDFLKTCAETMKSTPFPQAWEASVNEWKCSLEESDLTYLKSLSGVLGACDIQGQLTSLKRVESEFAQSLDKATSQSETKGRMFRSLGILGGIAVAVIAM